MLVHVLIPKIFWGIGGLSVWGIVMSVYGMFFPDQSSVTSLTSDNSLYLVGQLTNKSQSPNSFNFLTQDQSLNIDGKPNYQCKISGNTTLNSLSFCVVEKFTIENHSIQDNDYVNAHASYLENFDSSSLNNYFRILVDKRQFSDLKFTPQQFIEMYYMTNKSSPIAVFNLLYSYEPQSKSFEGSTNLIYVESEKPVETFKLINDKNVVCQFDNAPKIKFNPSSSCEVYVYDGSESQKPLKDTSLTKIKNILNNKLPISISKETKAGNWLILDMKRKIPIKNLINTTIKLSGNVKNGSYTAIRSIGKPFKVKGFLTYNKSVLSKEKSLIFNFFT